MQSRQTVLTSRSGLVNGMFHDSCSCALFHKTGCCVISCENKYDEQNTQSMKINFF